MIINTGQRTDIPAFYSQWFYQRIQEGYVDVRNPYHPQRVMRYQINPEVVDCLCFCTKNPQPMLSRLEEIQDFRQFWFVTITPYGNDIEPYVPSVNQVIKSFQLLSTKVGSQAVGWRYDPILIHGKYTVEYHIQAFEYIAKRLSSYTQRCVISFIDLYQKTQRNFPDIQEVSITTQHFLTREFVEIAKKYNIQVYACLESNDLQQYGVNTQGCMTKAVIEKAIGEELLMKRTQVREGCFCVIGNDVGAYNTCLHGCLYCYANENRKKVLEQFHQHDPNSSLLIGYIGKDDQIVEVKQKSNINRQLSLNI